jgi:hypothetical protein
LQDGEYRGCAAEIEQTAAVGWDMLIVTGAKTEKSAEFVVASTDPIGRTACLEPWHPSDPTFNTPVILFQPVVLEGAGPVLHVAAQR